MKLTPELKERIDHYFEQVTEEDLLKAFPDLVKTLSQKEFIYESEAAAIKANATGYIACKLNYSYFVIDASKGYDKTLLKYTEVICNTFLEKKAKEIIGLYRSKQSSDLIGIDINLICDDLKHNMWPRPLLRSEKVWNQKRQKQIDLLRNYNGKRNN